SAPGGPPPGMGGPPPGMGGPPPGFGPPPSAAPAPGAGNISCPRCGSSAPAGLAFCPQRGVEIRAAAPGPPPRGGRGYCGRVAAGGVDAFGGTIAAMGPEVQGLRAGVIGGGGAAGPASGAGAAALGSAPTPAAAQTWGQAVSVNRDGSDGERFPLGAEYVVFG